MRIGARIGAGRLLGDDAGCLLTQALHHGLVYGLRRRTRCPNKVPDASWEEVLAAYSLKRYTMV